MRTSKLGLVLGNSAMGESPGVILAGARNLTDFLARRNFFPGSIRRRRERFECQFICGTAAGLPCTEFLVDNRAGRARREINRNGGQRGLSSAHSFTGISTGQSSPYSPCSIAKSVACF